jgi:hypothetical protein
MQSQASERPRIYLRGGVWRCGQMLTAYDDWAIGFGATPREAYDNWKRTQRYAHFEQRAVSRA